MYRRSEDDLTENGKRRDRVRLLGGGALVLLPILMFYGEVFRLPTNLPVLDDYNGVLGFMNDFVQLSGFWHTLGYFIGSQHSLYKLFLLHAVVLGEYALTGHVNFVFLEVIADLFVLGIAWLLWFYLRGNGRTYGERLILFAPVVFFVFAPRYFENLNWALGGLQNFPVIFFALLSLLLLCRASRLSFGFACVSLIGSIGSSGNGFLLAMAGFFLLWQERSWRRLIAWCGVTLGMVAPYAYHYVRVAALPVASSLHSAVAYALYPLGFLGAASPRLKLSLLLALVLAGYGAFLIKNGWRKRDPATFYPVLFFVLTALAVAVARHPFGLNASLASRYTMYSQLLIVFLYLASLRLKVTAGWSAMWRSIGWGVFASVGLLYFLDMSATGERLLAERNDLLREHYALWSAQPQSHSLVPDENAWMKAPEAAAFLAIAQVNFRTAVRLEYYQPPPPQPVQTLR
jgi:hypothetical protein